MKHVSKRVLFNCLFVPFYNLQHRSHNRLFFAEKLPYTSHKNRIILPCVLHLVYNYCFVFLGCQTTFAPKIKLKVIF
ncbi:hypothetical protein L596_001778 [Steinernema carpocapsae]|uniref:Uncharacterized protein n=1 Tax=Steinernema carpocapsae TaxID=34508 RepID=A0A4U8UPA2_STECR|nr:hypothetical protein L596_001778 [Steinernema carpocapsae]